MNSVYLNLIPTVLSNGPFHRTDYPGHHTTAADTDFVFDFGAFLAVVVLEMGVELIEHLREWEGVREGEEGGRGRGDGEGRGGEGRR